jgi:protein-serine/threonine kinase
VSDAPHPPSAAGPPVSMIRPGTQGSMASTGGRQHLPNRGSYSQPVAPTVAGTNAQGRMAQPKDGMGGYNISAPLQNDQPEYGQPQISSKFAQIAGWQQGSGEPEPKTHKRSNTIGSLFGRSGSIFRKEQQTHDKPKKSYPPVSMTGAVGGTDTPRQSMDSSRRSISFGFGKKRSGSMFGGSQTTLQEKPRRFSLIPASFSLKAIGIGKEYGTSGAPPSDQQYESQPDSRGDYLDPPQPSQNVSGSTADYLITGDGSHDLTRDTPIQDRQGTSTASAAQRQRFAPAQVSAPRPGGPPQFLPPMNFRQDESALTTGSESSVNEFQQRRGPQGPYPPGFSVYDNRPPVGRAPSSGRGVLQKNNRKFADVYEQDQNNGFGQAHKDHGGSSGAARKVMDFFRRRGRDRV